MVERPKLIQLKQTEILTTYDLCKGDRTLDSIPLSVPIKESKQAPTYWWIKLEPRDFHGRWANTGKQIQKIKQEQSQLMVTRVKAKSIVHIKKNKNDETGMPARVLKVIGRDKYKVMLGTHGQGQIQHVTKEEIIKQHYKFGGLKRNVLKQLQPQQEIETAQIKEATPEIQEQIKKLWQDITNRANVYYAHYANTGSDLSTMGLTKEDLQHEAQRAALAGAKYYDEKKTKVDFKVFIMKKAEEGIKTAIAEKTSTWGMIHIPREERHMLAKIKQYRKDIKQTENRTPSRQETIAWAMTALKINQGAVEKLLAIPEQVISLHTVAMDEDSEGEDKMVYQLVDPADSAEEQIIKAERMKNVLDAITKTLTLAQAIIIKMKFGLEEKYMGQEYTYEQIQQELQRAGIVQSTKEIQRDLLSALLKLKGNKALQDAVTPHEHHEQPAEPKHFVIG